MTRFNTRLAGQLFYIACIRGHAEMLFGARSCLADRFTLMAAHEGLSTLPVVGRARY